jgi:hypothetical protein
MCSSCSVGEVCCRSWCLVVFAHLEQGERRHLLFAAQSWAAFAASFRPPPPLPRAPPFVIASSAGDQPQGIDDAMVLPHFDDLISPHLALRESSMQQIGSRRADGPSSLYPRPAAPLPSLRCCVNSLTARVVSDYRMHQSILG